VHLVVELDPRYHVQQPLRLILYRRIDGGSSCIAEVIAKSQYWELGLGRGSYAAHWLPTDGPTDKSCSRLKTFRRPVRSRCPKLISPATGRSNARTHAYTHSRSFPGASERRDRRLSTTARLSLATLSSSSHDCARGAHTTSVKYSRQKLQQPGSHAPRPPMRHLGHCSAYLLSSVTRGLAASNLSCLSDSDRVENLCPPPENRHHEEGIIAQKTAIITP
jgi:hypothetical protein